ncbi:hypothetical protein RUM44_000581 [Polyplax serrata]|uniref:Uncharacterized protein n=1 Tax=Polyplax serrata TaxID=468196 RepID=A0ABR1B5U9_POLSC
MIRVHTNVVKCAILMPKAIKNKYNFNSTGRWSNEYPSECLGYLQFLPYSSRDDNISTTPLTTPDTDTRNLRTQFYDSDGQSWFASYGREKQRWQTEQDVMVKSP